MNDNDLKGVTSIWLDMNKLFDEGVIKIVKELKNYKFLERFCIGSDGITEKSIDTIVDSFRDHKSLIVLDLGMYKATSDMGMITNNIGDDGLLKLLPLIENNNTLKYLSIHMNGISQEGINNMSTSVQKNNSLIYFEYTQYNVEIKKAVSRTIKHKIDENRKNYDGEVPTARVLKHGVNISKIDSIYRNNST